jgi:DNA-binding beta-propeller fold protein YncE
MRAPRLADALAPLLATAVVSGAAIYAARAERMVIMDLPPPDFALQGPALGGAQPPAGADRAAPAHLVGGPIVAIPGGALVADAESGDLIRTDDTGLPRARLRIGGGASQVVYEPRSRTAYVADRAGDAVVVVDVGDTLGTRTRWSTPTEPFGLALSPDGHTLLVTTVAARKLVALDTVTGIPRWQRTVAAEPRGVAIAPDGARALVTHLTGGAVTRVDLARGTTTAVPLVARSRATSGAPPGQLGRLDEATPGRTFARRAFAARFVGNGLALVPHQRSTPAQESTGAERTGSYGGGFDPPLEHAITFIAASDAGVPRTSAAQISAHQPEATAWDPARDRLFVAGFGSDSVLVIDGASQAAPWLAGAMTIPAVTYQGGGKVRAADGGRGCGPQGLAIDDRGGAWVYCAVSHTTARLPPIDGDVRTASVGAELGGGVLDAAGREGFDLFRRADPRISTRGAMACSSCHPEGRADGLSWRIEGHALQTPVLAGRIAGTGPFKWDGTDPSLMDSMTSTMRRLGGGGLTPLETEHLAAYVSTLARPRAPVRDAGAVARGAKVFDGEGCGTCHSDASGTDRERHDVGGSLAEVDTPSLVGLAISAPYYHDGSAATLSALLGGRGLVHGMSDAELAPAQLADLIAYLETL